MNALQALSALADEDPEDMMSADEVILRRSCYDPPRWQCVIRRRDKTKAYATAVREFPAEAFSEAVELHLIGPQDAPPPKPRSRARVIQTIPTPADIPRTRVRVRK